MTGPCRWLTMLRASIAAAVLLLGAPVLAQRPTYETPEALFEAMAISIGCEVEVLLSRQGPTARGLTALPPDKSCTQLNGRWTLISRSQTASRLAPFGAAPTVLLLFSDIPVQPSQFQITIPPAAKDAYDRDQIAAQRKGKAFIQTEFPVKLKQYLENMNLAIAVPGVVSEDILETIRTTPSERLGAAMMQPLKLKEVDYYVRIRGTSHAAFLSGKNGWGLLGTYSAEVVSVANASSRTTADHYGVIMLMSPGAR